MEQNVLKFFGGDVVLGETPFSEVEMVCVSRRKYGEVSLCVRAGMNVPFAQIKLYCRDRAVDADAAFDTATAFGNAIAEAWNQRNRPKAPTCTDQVGEVFREVCVLDQDSMDIYLAHSQKICPKCGYDRWHMWSRQSNTGAFDDTGYQCWNCDFAYSIGALVKIMQAIMENTEIENEQLKAKVALLEKTLHGPACTQCKGQGYKQIGVDRGFLVHRLCAHCHGTGKEPKPTNAATNQPSPKGGQ